MRIIFICGSLEPGRDGVGDYTRRLAGELIKQGHQAAAVALNDRHIIDELEGVQQVDELDLPVLRIPAVWTDKQRFDRVKCWVELMDPEWLSLQFVPFSFHPKGFVFGLGESLKLLGEKYKWHLMFHEPWVEGDGTISFKLQMLKMIQVYLIKGMVRKLSPLIMHTSNHAYKKILSQQAIAATILPLPSNIPVSDKALPQLYEEFTELGLGWDQRKSWCVLGTFGRIRPRVNFRPLLNQLVSEMNKQGRQVAFFSIGRTGASAKPVIEGLKAEFKNRVFIHEFGERSPEEVSAFLQLLDFGVASVLTPFLGKSGAVSAMKLHGLKVLVPEDVYDAHFVRMQEHDQCAGRKNALEFAPYSIAVQLTDALAQHEMCLLNHF